MDCTKEELARAWQRAYEKQNLLFARARAEYHAGRGSHGVADMVVADEICRILQKRTNKALLDRMKSPA